MGPVIEDGLTTPAAGGTGPRPHRVLSSPSPEAGCQHPIHGEHPGAQAPAPARALWSHPLG